MDKTFSEILGLSEQQVTHVLNEVAVKMGLADPRNIAAEVERQNDERFTQLIQQRFPKNVVLELLHQFIVRDDKAISTTVTDNAPVADIFEYVLGLAWYYISGESINVRKAYKMSLDADLLPLSHAAGYQGDLEFKYDSRKVLIEATLMDRSTQKRGELEPVIRHTANLAIENGDIPTQTIFVASELDNNVMNIFRSAQFIELNHSAKNGTIEGLNVFALTIVELIQLLNLDIPDKHIIEVINENLDNKPIIIKNGWREPIFEKMLS